MSEKVRWFSGEKRSANSFFRAGREVIKIIKTHIDHVAPYLDTSSHDLLEAGAGIELSERLIE